MLNVVMTAYRRPVYLRQTLESWLAVRGVENVLFTFHVEPSDRRLQVMDAIKRAQLPNYEVVSNQTRLGVLTNPWSAFENAFTLRGADFVVLAEDDVLVSDDVVEYLTWAAAEFRDDRQVMVVSAHSLIGGEPDGQVVREEGFSGLVWGTWADRWQGALSPTWDHDYSTGDHGHEAGWDWNIAKRVMPAAGAVQVRPVVSRSQHIGREGGAHMVAEDFALSVVTDWQQHVEPQDFRVISV